MSTVDTDAARPARPLCAYSPRWLSGPTPAYEGLVASWRPRHEPADEVERRLDP